MSQPDPNAPADPTAPPAAPADASSSAPWPSPSDDPTVPAVPAQADPLIAENAALKAQIAAMQAGVVSGPPPTTTVALSAAAPVDGYKPAVGNVVDYQATDPHTAETITGCGLVVEVTDNYAIVAPLTVLQLPVTVLHNRAGG